MEKYLCFILLFWLFWRWVWLLSFSAVKGTFYLSAKSQSHRSSLSGTSDTVCLVPCPGIAWVLSSHPQLNLVFFLVMHLLLEPCIRSQGDGGRGWGKEGIGCIGSSVSMPSNSSPHWAISLCFRFSVFCCWCSNRSSSGWPWHCIHVPALAKLWEPVAPAVCNLSPVQAITRPDPVELPRLLVSRVLRVVSWRGQWTTRGKTWRMLCDFRE